MMKQLREGVWQIECSGVNAYLADDDGTLTLIDAGTPRDEQTIRAAVAEAGYALTDIERVLITHYDVDHVGALAALGLDAEIYIGASDRGFFIGDEKPPLGNLKGALQRVTGTVTTPPAGEVTGVADGDTVGSFTVYYTPGHTPGHVAYVSETLSVAFVGDLVRESDGDLGPSPKPMSYDTERVRDSIEYLADAEPAVEVLAMGHGVPFVRNGAVRLAELGERIARL
ncbi:MBL fold metallo-hydrolase [Halosegnis rubeus]|uniref:MBL fold metallo-hydrolase n=1 Tax=Halosegnis rubeus TaxID=2212850 RepID=A0A5N5UMP6_9EURY|nr:MBL fold metallo-hydrolase [Halosegnis rubeus]KAB7517197.1 MBL fold metallo-hydrolase [Halosegnis rubeus]KAB7519682.1 MBL fold metallo-hydrolase [Halosegnis rubeus]